MTSVVGIVDKETTIASAGHWHWFWQAPPWHWAYGWALAILLLPLAVSLVVRMLPTTTRNPRPLLDVLNGADCRWSTSKTSVAIWTAAVWWALLAILFHNKGIGNIGLEKNVGGYAVLLGIPAATAVAARSITASRDQAGTKRKTRLGAPTTNPVTGIGQILSDDNGKTDLLDSQYFGFSLLLLGYFVFRFVGHPDLGLPNLPDTLLGLTGVAAAAYIGKKGFADPNAKPEIRSVIPRRASRNKPVRIRGVNLATATDKDVAVLFGDEEGKIVNVVVDTYGASVFAEVPTEAPADDVELRVSAYDGRLTEPVAFTIAS